MLYAELRDGVRRRKLRSALRTLRKLSGFHETRIFLRQAS